MPRSLVDKVWDAHVVTPATSETPAVLFIDLQLVHEVTSPQAFTVLNERGIKVRCPERVFATIDHATPTIPVDQNGEHIYYTDEARNQVQTLEKNCAEHGIEFFGWGNKNRGVVHVAGPENGRVKPGMTIVCGDSHTATHGAFGALAFGIGTTEVGHVLATQCLLQQKAKSMAVTVNGRLPEGVSAKDLILAIIAEAGVDGGTGHIIEYRGEAIEALSMEGRMTVCNMSIELGARAGLIAPDETTLTWLKKHAGLSEQEISENRDAWLGLASDEGAKFDKEIVIDAASLSPMVTWGTTPATGIKLGQKLPSASDTDDAKALNYMGFSAGDAIVGQKVSVVFIGSCTNGRFEDLQAAASILRGRRVADGVRMLVVPGSDNTKAEAEAAGLDKVFSQAGAEWREPGCSMCLAMNGDMARPGELVVSTSNRNFMGRQGPGARTVLASPATAAASAVAGEIADPREYAPIQLEESA